MSVRTGRGRVAGNPDEPDEALLRRQRWCALGVALATLAAAAYLCWLAVTRYRIYSSNAFDLGINQQEVWLIAHGYRPFATTRGLHFLGDHFTPVLYVLGPLHRIFTEPEYIIVVQSLLLPLGAIPFYRLALRGTGRPELSLLLTCCFLCHPCLWGMGLFDFHPLTLAITPLIAAVDAADSDHPSWFLAFCGAALLCEERVAPAVFLLGLLAVFWRRWKIGWWVAGFSIVYFFTAMKLMAYFGETHASSYLSLYGVLFRTLHNRPLGVPGVIFQKLTMELSLRYMDLMLAPLVFLSLAAPEVLLIAAPVLLSNLLSDRYASHLTGFQYDSVPLAFAAAAAAVGVGRVLRVLEQGGRKEGPRLLAALMFCSVLLSARHYVPGAVFQWCFTRITPSLVRERDQLLATIPPDASVSAPSPMVPQLAQRRYVYMFPNPFHPLCYGSGPEALAQEEGRELDLPVAAAFEQNLRRSTVEYIVLAHGNRFFFPFGIYHRRQYNQLALDALSCSDYGLIGKSGDLLLLKRGADYRGGLRLLQVELPASPEDDEARAIIKEGWERWQWH